MKSVNGDTTRRVIVKSGYVDNNGRLVDDPAQIANLKPIGCLECHQAFEGHGGNRVNNVQVCVMCHNPQLTTSGRTIPDNVTIDNTVKTKLGSNPLLYPEVTQNMGELIHRLHAGWVGSTTTGTDPLPTSTAAAGLRERNVRVNNFQIVRNRRVQNESRRLRHVRRLGRGDVSGRPDALHEVPLRCQSQRAQRENQDRHPRATVQSYKPDLPAGVLFTTETVGPGNTSETLAQILGFRQSFQGHDRPATPPTWWTARSRGSAAPATTVPRKWDTSSRPAARTSRPRAPWRNRNRRR